MMHNDTKHNNYNPNRTYRICIIDTLHINVIELNFSCFYNAQHSAKVIIKHNKGISAKVLQGTITKKKK